MNKVSNNIQFLAGGGEMGRLTREKDWSETSLGPVTSWPQSLRTALSIILKSKFPMFLFWGEELICFYNDAYRPSLGINGKHPSILGMKAEKAWSEIWPVIKPLIDQVLGGGEGTWSEDQLIPIYRNGKLEDVYWTFSYSPVNDETDKPVGVFVTCVETTDKIAAFKKSEESKRELEFAIDATDLGIWDYNPQTNKFSANDRLKKWFGLSSNEQIELSHAINAIKETERQRVTDAIERALDFSSGGNYDIEYTIVNPVSRVETIVHAKGRAWFNKEKKAYRFNGTLEDITKQASILKQIKESEERYHHLIYSSPSAIGILYGEELFITIANDAIIEIWGKNKDIIGKPYFEALPELAEQGYKEVFAEVYKTGIPFNAIETPVEILQHGVKTLKYYNFLLYAQRNINSEIDGIGIIATEVTSQALLNKQIGESAKRFRLLADSMPQQVWTSDPEGNLNYYNQSVLDYSGLTPEQINKDGWLQIVHPDDREKNIEQWGEAIKTGNDFLFEHRFRQHDGQYRWQLSRAIPQRDEQGKIQLWVGTSTDIQDRKTFTDELKKQVEERTKELIELNESLKKSEERYHLMVEEVQDYAILYLNREGIVENWNTGAQKIKGYKSSEIIGRSFSNFYTEEDKKNGVPQKLLTLAGVTGRAVQEGWRVRKDGSLFWASIVITAVHNQQNEVIGFSKVTHDLTDKREAEDILRKNSLLLEQKNAELEKMNEQLQSFAYISSHDLQEPLRKIQTFISQLMEKEVENLTNNGKYIFSRIQHSALRMQTLINDLLAYSRTNNNDEKFEVTDLNKVVEDVRADMKEEFQQKDASIVASGQCKVNIIPFQFRQLLHNLLSNSLKFSSPDRTLVITIKSEIVSGQELKNEKLSDTINYCHINVSDNGLGFESRYENKIFELFQRLHGKEEYTGTGIGLAIVKKIVENHQGIIVATGELNKGASFDIYLPIAEGSTLQLAE